MNKQAENIMELLKRISGRILIAYNSYAVWKALKGSLSIPETGEEEAKRRVKIMSYYESIFPTVLYSLESTFVVEICKFFDKGNDKLKIANPESLEAGIAKMSIAEEDKKHIHNLISKNIKTINQLMKLRHTLYAHDPLLKPESQERPLIPPTQDIDALFDSIKEIQNIISKNTTGVFHAWHDDNTNFIFKEMLYNLEKGREQRFKESNEEMDKKYKQQ